MLFLEVLHQQMNRGILQTNRDIEVPCHQLMIRDILLTRCKRGNNLQLTFLLAIVTNLVVLMEDKVLNNSKFMALGHATRDISQSSMAIILTSPINHQGQDILAENHHPEVTQDTSTGQVDPLHGLVAHILNSVGAAKETHHNGIKGNSTMTVTLEKEGVKTTGTDQRERRGTERRGNDANQKTRMLVGEHHQELSTETQLQPGERVIVIIRTIHLQNVTEKTVVSGTKQEKKRRRPKKRTKEKQELLSLRNDLS